MLQKIQNYMQSELSEVTVWGQSEYQNITIFHAPLLRNFLYQKVTLHARMTRYEEAFSSSENQEENARAFAPLIIP